MTEEEILAMREREVCVYALKGLTSNYGVVLKIGITNDAMRRKAQLESADGNPFQERLILHVVGSWTCWDRELALKAESRLHGTLRVQRIEGEWFEWTDSGAADAALSSLVIAYCELTQNPESADLVLFPDVIEVPDSPASRFDPPRSA